MSVINQMLRDLDARGEADRRRGAALAVSGQGALAAKPPSRSRRVALLGMVGFLLVAGIVLLVAMRPAVDAPSAAVVQAATVVEADAAFEAAPVAGAARVNEEAPPKAAAPAIEVTPSSTAPPAPTTAEASVPAPVTARVAEAPPTPRVQIERIDDGPRADPVAPARDALSAGDANRALAVLGAPGLVSAEAEALRAAALQQLGRHAEAASAYRRALASEPDIGAWWAGLGISLEALGEPAEAREAFLEAQRRGPLAPALTDYLRDRVDALSADEPPR